MLEVILGVIFFSTIVLALVFVIIGARSQLVSSGDVSIEINHDSANSLVTAAGSRLLQTLANNNIFLSSACGGVGTCGQCSCIVESGGGSALPIEGGFFNLAELKQGWRLSCQTPVKQDMKIIIPEEVFGVRKWECEVVSNNNVATFIKELVLKLPPGEEVDFKAGGFVQMEVPPHEMQYKDIVVEEEFREDWGKFKLWELKSSSSDVVIRAYSMANYPEEKGILKFNVRISTPPPGTDYPPGIVSSYVFNLKPGDKFTVFGPFGDFFIKDTENEMIYIGGGAGMAPLRSHIFDLLKKRKSNRKISYWYGARSLRELFYDDEFDGLAKAHKNFSWNVAMSDPLPEDKWQGYTGFIHQVVYENYLKNHHAPEDIEYYLCGPPMMNQAVFNMLDNLGVEKENIAFDDFGG